MARQCPSWLAIGAGLALLGQAQTAQATVCKLALALALDISSSVNQREYDIQLHGLARAFRTPEIIEAILAPEGSGVAVTVYEWSGYNQQDVVVPWILLETPEAVLDIAARLTAHRRPYSDLSTALGKAVEYGALLFSRAPDCARRVIDISGDGANNDGPSPNIFRERGLFSGMTINGLAIQGATPDPAEYYRRNVIHGPGAFLALARDFDDYPSVIIGKLLREIDQEMIMGEAALGTTR
jgi:hypothetical protein